MRNAASKVPKNVTDPDGQWTATERQVSFVRAIQLGMEPVQAAKYAGIKVNQGVFIKRAAQNKWVRNQLEAVRKEIEARMKMSRQKVQDIVVDAVDIAKVQGDPATMIKGANELNKMLGYHSPEKHILVSDALQATQEELEQLPYDELLELAGEEMDAIDVEFERIDVENAENIDVENAENIDVENADAREDDVDAKALQKV